VGGAGGGGEGVRGKFIYGLKDSVEGAGEDKKGVNRETQAEN